MDSALSLALWLTLVVALLRVGVALLQREPWGADVTIAALVALISPLLAMRPNSRLPTGLHDR